jgi:lipoprotein-anchoring transpeptidase ErfK/SrfK
MTWFLTLALFAVAAQSAQSAQPALPPGALEAIGIQVALDREGFSSGVIDGRIGANTRRAVEAYRQQNGRDPVAAPQPVMQYRITSEDVAGPFVERIPSDLMEQSKLPALGYRSVVEALSERFHTTPELLQWLNPSATFAADTTIHVPGVEPQMIPAAVPTAQNDAPRARATGTSGGAAASTGSQQDVKPDVIVRVSRSAKSLTVTAADGKILFFAPVTTGSDNDPLPIGEWTVNGVQHNPSFKYNPDLFWDADPGHTKATVPPGPNGPVGVVWIDISKEHYGLHGSPEPSQIGRTESHGCVRLTNWDALRVAALVKHGTRVVFAE